MKLRRLPEDFRVEELTSVATSHGPFGLYRLTKTSIGTPEAVSAIVERWKVPRKRISYGGLKDRHAITLQHLTIHNGPRKSLRQNSLELEYLGQVSKPFTPADFHGNRFQLVLRDMQDTEIQRAEAAVLQVQQTGLPNYFDDQRFGSLGISGDWIARAWCLSNWERALWLALADPHLNDSSTEKKQKQILREMWGQWPECQQRLDRSHRRSIVTYLSDKAKVGRDPDFRGALARINVDLRGLYLSAWQSALWNRWLTRFIEAHSEPAALASFDLLSGRCVFPLTSVTRDAGRTEADAGTAQTEFDATKECLADPAKDEADIPASSRFARSGLRTLNQFESAEWMNTELQLPSARIDRPEGLAGELLDAVLQDEKIELRELRVKYPRDSFFSKGMRRAFIRPNGLSSAVETDELHDGRRKLTLSFDLPRGSYATILVKRLTEVI